MGGEKFISAIMLLCSQREAITICDINNEIISSTDNRSSCTIGNMSDRYRKKTPQRIFFCNQEHFKTVVKKQVTTRLQNKFCETRSQFRSLIMGAITVCCVHIAMVKTVSAFLL